ncbi:hypothetical protein ABPG73_008347 [Tetrahymena malaccensis]
MNKQKDSDYAFKIAIIGNTSSGKSSLMKRFTEDIFNETFVPTIGVDFKTHSLTLDNETVNLNIWDTSGQEKYENIVHAYCNVVHGCIFLFDLTDHQTFQDVQKWLDKFKQSTQNEVKYILVGNKADLIEQRTVSFEEASNLAKKLDMQYIEISAKLNQNIDNCFIQLTQDLIQQHLKQNQQHKLEEKKDSFQLKSTAAIKNSFKFW